MQTNWLIIDGNNLLHQDPDMRDRARRAGFASALEAWQSITGPPGVVQSIEEKRELRAERAKSLADRMDVLLAR